MAVRARFHPRITALQRRRFSAARRDVIARQSACRHDLPRACRTISRFLYLRFRRRQPFLLAGDLSPAPATYPELVAERAAPRPLFGLAPHGVCPASRRYRGRGALLP